MKTHWACGLVISLLAVGCSSDSVDTAGSEGPTAGRAGSSGTSSSGARAGTAGRASEATASTGTPRAGQGNLGGFENGGSESNAAGGLPRSDVGTSVAGNAGTLSALPVSVAGGTAVAQVGGSPSTGGVTSIVSGLITGGFTAVGGNNGSAGAVIGTALAAGGAAMATGGVPAAAGSAVVATGGVSIGSGGATGVGGTSASGGGLAIAGNSPTGGTCATTYYRDADNDTWGGVEVSCTGAFGWVTRAGDCNDSNADVHPEQTETFAVSYVSSNGSASYDYNCDGTETTAGGVQISTGACVSSGLGNSCTGDGYLSVEPPRVGVNLNQVCGSTRYLLCARSQQTCVGAISTEGTTEAVRCK